MVAGANRPATAAAMANGPRPMTRPSAVSLVPAPVLRNFSVSRPSTPCQVPISDRVRNGTDLGELHVRLDADLGDVAPLHAGVRLARVDVGHGPQAGLPLRPVARLGEVAEQLRRRLRSRSSVIVKEPMSYPPLLTPPGSPGLAGEQLVRLEVPGPRAVHDLLGQRRRRLPDARSQPDSGDSSQSRTNCLSYDGWARPGCHSSAGQKREESGVSTSSASTVVKSARRPNSNLVSARMIPLLAGDLLGPAVDGEGQHPQLGRGVVADLLGDRLEVDVLVVLAERGLGRRGEDRLGQPAAVLEPGGQRDAAHLAVRRGSRRGPSR